ncbi:hypothetical protein Tco_0155670 [Tanacetum coccineum]
MRRFTSFSVLYRTFVIKPWLRFASGRTIQAGLGAREIHAGSCSMHSGPRYCVGKNGGLRSGAIPQVGYRHRCLPRCSGGLKIPYRGIDYFTNGLRRKYWSPPIQGFGLKDLSGIHLCAVLDYWRNSASDITGKQFCDKPFNDWCSEIKRGQPSFSLVYGTGSRYTAEIGMQKYSYRDHGDFVYRAYDASLAVRHRKAWDQSWEGPYEVTERNWKGDTSCVTMGWRYASIPRWMRLAEHTCATFNKIRSPKLLTSCYGIRMAHPSLLQLPQELISPLGDTGRHAKLPAIMAWASPKNPLKGGHAPAVRYEAASTVSSSSIAEQAPHLLFDILVSWQHRRNQAYEPPALQQSLDNM